MKKKLLIQKEKKLLINKLIMHHLNEIGIISSKEKEKEIIN